MNAETGTAWMSYSGICRDGPWKGHNLESDVPKVEHDSIGSGYYCHVGDEWHWFCNKE
jgi:hypothetical protein